MPTDAAPISSTPFGWIDWAVVVGYLMAATALGAKLAGRQATIRDFFLAGRKLPWWAICGSIIATEISAVTFLAVPTISFAEQGNFTYLQLAIGAILARVIIGVYFVPRFYEGEIYSPYDYMGRRLGPRVKTVTTGLFLVGAVLGQGARVYITAFVLSSLTALDLTASIWAIGLVSIGWTLMGGMTTVIWTDVVQFVVLVIGACVVLGCALAAVPGSLIDSLDAAGGAGKFAVFDLSTDPTLAYTLWCGLLATPFLNLAAFGTDQVMAQRMFCCRDARDARRAIIFSSVSVAIAVLMLLVGAAIYCYVRALPAEAAHFSGHRNVLLPEFIKRFVPTGVRGLIIAAIFASAISTLDSALAALSQATASAFVHTGRRRRRGLWARLTSSEIGLSKTLVIAWGAVLCGMATACILIDARYANTVDLVFDLVAYTYGPMLGVFLLAMLPVGRDGSGLYWAVPSAMLAVFAVSVHPEPVELGFSAVAFDWANWVVWLGLFALLVLALVRLRQDLGRTSAVVAAAIVILLLRMLSFESADGEGTRYLAWPWSYPIGTLVTFGLGYAMGRPCAEGVANSGGRKTRRRAGVRS